MEILFWRHQTKAQEQLKICKIYCRLTINGNRADIGSTNIEVPFDDFDTKRQEITTNNLHFAQPNLRLNEEFKSPILSIYTELLLKKQPITSDIIKRIFLQVDKQNKRLMEAYDEFLKDFEEKTKPKKDRKGNQKEARRSLSTLRPLRVCRNKLLTYLIFKKQQHITIEELHINWFDAYENWLYDVPHEQATVLKHLRTLKQITKFSKKKDFASFDPFENRELEREEIKDPNFLTQEQFEQWKIFKFGSQIAQEVADIFAIYCRTGFHYQDLKQVIADPDKFIRKGLDGNKWIYKPREKTGEMAKVPFESFHEIKPFIEKYGGWKNLPIKQNHVLNMWLKVCVAEINIHLPQALKIYEKLSVKHGRCTITDWWFNELGNSDDDLLPILGRKTKEGLERYGRPDERAVIKALKKR